VRPVNKVKKILIIRTDRIGDLVCTIPSIKTLKKNFSEAEIFGLLSPVNGELLRDTALLDHIFVWNNRMTTHEKRDLFKNLKEKNFDMAFVFSPLTESYSLAKKSGASLRGGIVIKSRIVTRFTAFLWLTHTYLLDQEGRIARNEPVLHEIEKGFSLLKLFGVEDFEKDITFSLPEKVLKEKGETLNSLKFEGQKGVIGLPLCCRYGRAGWSAKDMAQLAESLKKKFPWYLIFITYGVSEKKEGEFLEEKFKRERNIAVKGFLPLQLWAALMQSLSLVISIDSGAVHVAASGKVPSIVLYPQEIFRLCREEWTPWQILHRQLVMEGFAETVGNILHSAEQLLGCDEMLTKF